MHYFEFIYEAYELNKVNKLLSENEEWKGISSEIVAAEHYKSRNRFNTL